MKIKLSDKSNKIIAEEIDGGDGYFVKNEVGEVFYVNDSEKTNWYVNCSPEKFVESVKIFNQYSDEVINHDSEEKQLEVVFWLKNSLLTTEQWSNIDNSYWNVIVQQAEFGHL